MKRKINLFFVLLIIFFYSCMKDEIYVSPNNIKYNCYDTLLYTDSEMKKIDTLIFTRKKDTIIFYNLTVKGFKNILDFGNVSEFSFKLYTDTLIIGVIQLYNNLNILINGKECVKKVYINRFFSDELKISYEKVSSFEYSSYIYYLRKAFYFHEESGLVGYKNKKTNITMYLYKYLPYKN